jgi:hypothetical protein
VNVTICDFFFWWGKTHLKLKKKNFQVFSPFLFFFGKIAKFATKKVKFLCLAWFGIKVPNNNNKIWDIYVWQSK